jgi:hypothetical protein
MLQQLLVAVIVFAAACYAVWRLPGTATRLKMAEGLARVLPGAAGRWFARLATRQRAALVAGGCGACGGAAAPRQTVVRRR